MSEKRLVIVQLTDLHIEDKHTFWVERAEQVGRAVASNLGFSPNCALLFSGDVAYSGLKSQYELADKFLQRLKTVIVTAFPSAIIESDSIPGNHDCAFPEDTEARDVIVDNIVSKAPPVIKDSSINACTSVQDEFFHFAKWTITKASDKLMHKSVFVFPGLDVGVVGLNTGWVSKKNEKQGAIIFPESLSSETSFQSRPDLSVVMLHHPFNWVASATMKSLQSNLERGADVLLTGHIHEQDSYTISRKPLDKSLYIEGAALCESYDTSISGFNVLLVDCINKTFEVRPYQLSKDIYELDASRVRTHQYVSSTLSSSIRFKDEFQTFLTDTGIQLTNRGKIPSLDDIFIPPCLKRLNIEDADISKDHKILRNHASLKCLFETQKLLIYGNTDSGKTTLAKITCSTLSSKGIFPIYVSGEAIKNSHLNHENVFFEEVIAELYQPDCIERVKQAGCDNLAIVIDRYNRIKFNNKGRSIFLENLGKIAARIILFSETLPLLDETPGSAEIALFDDFTIVELCAVHPADQLEMIKRWVTLGREHEIAESDLVIEVNALAKTVDLILNSKMLPAYPIFVLSILQIVETGKALETISGSIAYFYEELLTQRLEEQSRPEVDIPTKHQVLSEVAFFCYKRKQREFTLAEFRQVAGEYEKKYLNSVNEQALLRELENAAVLKRTRFGYAFFYGYLSCYYVARYINHYYHFEQTRDAMKREIEDIVTHIYIEANANIVIFLSFMSATEFLIQKMLSRASSLFAKEPECDFEKQCAFLTNQNDDLPIALGNDGPLEARRKRLEHRESDRMEQANEASQPIHADEDDSNIGEMNIAFKLMQVMGQTLKSFPGTLPGDLKKSMLTEGYKLGLRCAGGFIAAVGEDQTELFELIKGFLQRKFDEKNASRAAMGKRAIEVVDLDETAKEMMYFIVQLITLGILRHTAFTLCSEKLGEVHVKVLEERGDVAFRLIDLEGQMEQGKTINPDDVEKILSKIDKKSFTFGILRWMVFEYLSVNWVPIQIKQSLCAACNISVDKKKLLVTRERK